MIPPSLSVDNQDAGVNSPPAITAVRGDTQQLAEPGPVLFDKGPTAGTLNVTLIDTDLDDTLYVSVFVDYNLPDQTPPRAGCVAAPSGSAIRSCGAPLTALCQTDDINVQRNMTVVVFDREPINGGDPAFQQLPPDGLSTGKFYFLKCKTPT